MSPMPHISFSFRSDEVTFLMLRILHPSYIQNCPRKLDEAAAYCVAKIQERIPLNSKIFYRFGSSYRLPLKTKELIDAEIIRELIIECLTFCHSDVEISVSATPKTIFWKLHTYNPECCDDSITVDAIMRKSHVDKATWTENIPTVETYRESYAFANCPDTALTYDEFDFGLFLQDLEAKQLKLKEISTQTLAKQIRMNAEDVKKRQQHQTASFFASDSNPFVDSDSDLKSHHRDRDPMLANFPTDMVEEECRCVECRPAVNLLDYSELEDDDFGNSILRYETGLKMRNIERIHREREELKLEELSISETHSTDVEAKKDQPVENVDPKSTTDEEKQIIAEIVQKLKAYRGKKLLRGVIKEMKLKKPKKNKDETKKEKGEEKEVQVTQSAAENSECICKCLTMEDKKRVKKDLKTARKVAKRKNSPPEKKEKTVSVNVNEQVSLTVCEPAVSNIDLDSVYEKHFEALNVTDDIVKKCHMNNAFIKTYWDLYDDQIREIRALKANTIINQMRDKLTLIDQPILCIKKEAESLFATSLNVRRHQKVFSVMNISCQDLQGVELKLRQKSPWIEIEEPQLASTTYDVRAGETVDISITFRETQPESMASFSLVHCDKEVAPRLYIATEKWITKIEEACESSTTKPCMAVVKKAELSVLPYDRLLQVLKENMPTDPEVTMKADLKPKSYVEELTSCNTNPVYVSKLEIQLHPSTELGDDQLSTYTAREPEEDETVQDNDEVAILEAAREVIAEIDRIEVQIPAIVYREEREPDYDYEVEDETTEDSSTDEGSEYEIVEEGVEALTTQLDEEDRDEWFDVVDKSKP